MFSCTRPNNSGMGVWFYFIEKDTEFQEVVNLAKVKEVDGGAEASPLRF